MIEKIEILSTALLDQERMRVDELKGLAGALGIGFGWHYLLDLTWILRHLAPEAGLRVLDAGAGTGLLQWYLADRGLEILSVDRVSRAALSLRYHAHYRVNALQPGDLLTPGQVYRRNLQEAPSWGNRMVRAVRGLAGLARIAWPGRAPGRVTFYNHDLDPLPLVPDNSQDAVVAVSSLEHNSPEGLVGVVDELMRVLKPGGKLLATLGAARDQDWFHEPSSGWCYTDRSLRRIFKLPADTPSNYAAYDSLFAALKNCAELRDNLADFYYQSGDNGMPWGKWDPQYQPVGVCKVKSTA